MEEDNKTRTQEEVFRDKTDHYIVCFLNHCPLREQCLRWLVGQYVDPTRVVYSSINPHNPHYGNEHCGMFRPNRKAIMKRGFKNMYHEMPGYMEHNIRRWLILLFGRKQYFEMRKGERLITPEQQQQILETCRTNGWQGPINYDGEQEDWLW
ncbi:MAG: hypothetical protein IKZ62_02300 [Prevotella sp.]|nr:hypothetical protein [Prevotella sp.]